MEVMGSNFAARLTAWQIYLCQRAWDLVIEVCLQKAAEVLLVSSILMKNFDGRGTLLLQDGFDLKVGTVSIEMTGKSPRSEESAECSSLMEGDLTQYAKSHVLDAKFLDGPDTNIRVPNSIEISMAAKSKDEGGSEDDKDEDDEDDANEEDFGEEGEEDVSSEDAEDKNGDAAGGEEDDEDEEEEDDANNGNNGSGDDEDDEDDEEEDEHGEGEEEDDEDEDDEEDEEDEEALHPPKKRKK